MRPDLVVPESEFPQRHIQRIQRHHLQTIEFIFECAEEPLDPAILPRATRIAALMADAEQELGTQFRSNQQLGELLDQGFLREITK